MATNHKHNHGENGSVDGSWIPSRTDIDQANVTALMRQVGVTSYDELHTWSVAYREEFWRIASTILGIRFRAPYDRVLDLDGGAEYPRWFAGASMNIVDSCFQARPDQTAIVTGDETGAIRTVTCGELESASRRVAGGLAAHGFAPGDAIAIAMPITVDAVCAYLGIIMAGCVVVSIADSFAAQEIAARLRIGRAKAIFTQDVIVRGDKHHPLYEKAIQADAPMAIVGSRLAHTKLRDGDIDWQAFLGDSDDFEAVAADPDDAINVLFSSGTTGEPKAIPWTQTTPIKCAADACFHQNVKPGDVLAWPTNLGWMMGPWLVFASLINKAALALFDGAPTSPAFGKFVQDAHVTMLGVVPSLVSAWRRDRSMETFDWSAIKVFSSTGEASNADDMQYLMSLAGRRPVIEYCGGTEIGGGYITCVVVKPCVAGTFNTFALGLDGVLRDESGAPTDNGEVFLVPPSVGLSTSLLNANHHDVYYKDVPAGPNDALLRRHGDRIERLPGGLYRALGRIDDTMNLGGIKVSAAEIERAVHSALPVAEVAAVAVSPAEGGPSRLVIYVVPQDVDNNVDTDFETQAQRAISQTLNPLFHVHDLIVIGSLPRTASNKIMRRVLRDQYSGARNGGSP